MPILPLLRQSVPDTLRHSQFPRECLSRWLGTTGAIHRAPEGTARRLRAYAQSESPRHLGTLAASLRPALDRGDATRPAPRRPDISRTLLVKAPGANGEKGVILSYFEYNWSRLLHGIPDYADFARRYTVVHLPSWSPTNYEILARIISHTPDDQPVYLQPAHHREREKLAAFHPRIRLVDGLACDWVHPRYFEPRPWSERDIDVLVVSNWAPFKRHWELFHTLARLPRELRVVCVGQPDSGKTLADIRKLQRDFRAPQDIEYLESIPIDRVTDLQCRARVSALFSRWEGGCVAAVEALMAGSVLAMRRDARIGARAHVNVETGVTFLRHDAPARLMGALETGGSLRPREWACEHISSDQTLSRLNATLRADALAAGQLWTADLAPMCYRPYLTLVHDDDYQRLAPAAAELTERYPTVFAGDWMDRARR